MPRKPRKSARGGMTVSEAGRKGGRTTKDRHGPKFYETIGRKGGQTTKTRHGPAFYERIGKKGGQEMKRLIAAAKKKRATIGE